MREVGIKNWGLLWALYPLQPALKTADYIEMAALMDAVRELVHTEKMWISFYDVERDRLIPRYGLIVDNGYYVQLTKEQWYANKKADKPVDLMTSVMDEYAKDKKISL